MRGFLKRRRAVLEVLEPRRLLSSTLYGADGDNELFTFNTATGSAHVIGHMPVLMTALAENAQGQLFGTTNGGGDLYRINTANAAVTQLSFNQEYQGIAFGPDGKLYGQVPDELVTINSSTGAIVTHVSSPGVASNLAFDATGTLYGIDSGLQRINTSTGQRTFVGPQESFALAYGTDNVMYAVNGFFSQAIVSVNLSTGSGTPVSVLSGTDGSLILCATGAARAVVALPTVTIHATDPAAAEPGNDTGTFTVSRSGSTASALTAKYSIAGTATNGSDYNSLSGSVTIPAGKSSATIVITPKDDTTPEPTETVVLTLAGSTSYSTGSPSSATVNIADNDKPQVTIAATDATASEPGTDTGKFTITRKGSTTSSLTVKYSIGGTATNGADDSSLSGTVTIPVGASSATIAVTPKDDTLIEGNESVVLTLIAGSAYSAASPASATVNIQDNDIAGTTILVHGYNLFGSLGSALDYWGTDKIKQLLEVSGKGKVWLYSPSTGNYSDVTSKIPAGKWSNSAAGEQILVFDWLAASNDAEGGQAEAAADALFASLVSGGYVNPSAHTTSRPLHFIGHSRGTSVVSETVQRLGLYSIPVSYVTYLDAHDFGEPGIPFDEDFHDPAVQVWDNVAYADNYWQVSSATLGVSNPGGHALAAIPDWPTGEDRELTKLPGFSTYPPRPHTQVINYYWGTIATGTQNSSWYQGGNGSGFGFSKWINGGGYNRSRDTHLNRANSKTSANIFPYYWNNSNSNDNGKNDDNGVPPVLFDGDFQIPDLDADRLLSTDNNSIAGWAYHGGGGGGHLAGTGSIAYLQLDYANTDRTHNRFYLPSADVTLSFDLRVDVPKSSTSLTISITKNGSAQTLGTFNLTAKTTAFAEHKLTVPSAYRNSVDRLTFQITDGGLLGTPEVDLDNIAFSTTAVSTATPQVGLAVLSQTSVASAPSWTFSWITPPSITWSDVTSAKKGSAELLS